MKILQNIFRSAIWRTLFVAGIIILMITVTNVMADPPPPPPAPSQSPIGSSGLVMLLVLSGILGWNRLSAGKNIR